MTKVFLSGSRQISRLPSEVAARIDALIEAGLDVVVGDANGADRVMQRYLADHNYQRVEVYFSGSVQRNNVGDWPTVQVPVEAGVKGREFYTRKDRAMARAADFGLVVWDGKSEGSIANVKELASQGKKTVVYVAPARRYVVVRQPPDLLALSAGSGAAENGEPSEQAAFRF